MEEGNEQVGRLYELFIHPKYDPLNFINDIAVIKLKTRFTYNEFVQPITIGKPAIEAKAGGSQF